jgi:hypothetical protein
LHGSCNTNHEQTQNTNIHRGFGMKKYLIVGLSFSLIFFAIASVSGAIDMGFDKSFYSVLAGTVDIDNFDQATGLTVMILLATGVVGLFSISRSKLKK